MDLWLPSGVYREVKSSKYKKVIRTDYNAPTYQSLICNIDDLEIWIERIKSGYCRDNEIGLLNFVSAEEFMQIMRKRMEYNDWADRHGKLDTPDKIDSYIVG